MTSSEQQMEIEIAFRQSRYMFKCPVHGWIVAKEGEVAKEDHAECGLVPDYSDEDRAYYNPTVHEAKETLEVSGHRNLAISSAMKQIERREINN